MDGKSMDIAGDKLNQLKAILPEAFTENKIDWEKLRAALGDNIEFKNERYVLNWAGKSDAFRALQAPSTATLSPCPEESVYFEQSGNVFIEGENLEVLKALQKSYFGKIKMIYIDPPYNTGNDHFIYPDRFSESREDYLSRIGDKDETGLMTREGLFRKNSKDGGHYHSNWLSMMYPRLFLARNLLRDDGVIFVSIDDNEVHNLRLLMNEVFGEENFSGNFLWHRRQRADSRNQSNVSTDHEYIVAYSKSENAIQKGVSIDTEKYGNPDNDPRGPWASIDLSGLATAAQRPNLHYDIVDPATGNVYPPNPTRGWSKSKENVRKMIGEGRILFPKNPSGRPREKKFLNDLLTTITGFSTCLDSKVVGYTTNGTREVTEIFKEKYFDFPKPSTLIKVFIEQASSINSQDIILDFFAGSCTTAHAVLELNREDGGNRKFICVQLPEKCDENTEAYKAGYSTIAEIGKERIRRVIRKISDDQSVKLDLDGRAASQDLGFKVFKLRESNFKIWRTAIETEEDLVAQMQQHLEPLDEHAKIEDILYELLLKAGVPLTADIRAEEGFLLANNGEIALALERADEDVIKKILAMKPQKVFTLDRLFKQNDKLKTNTALQMKDAGIEFKVI
ncbi:MAG TPA: site-specific DNA-methyltransferase [Smithellaceae bacterium]|jgi:adenine-specific DNA-methyltransferase|nr:site-specific DNA-methyltransferase [Smithellaceae bacterium]